MLKNMIGKYKKRRREEVKNPSVVAEDQQSKRLAADKFDSNTSSILFRCREGSVTHYYHFFFGALVPLIEYHLENPTKILRILTDVGPFKHVLCELPLTIAELHGPNLTQTGRYHDDKSLNHYKQAGEISLKGYDCFNNEFYKMAHFPKPPKSLILAVNQFLHDSVPFYIRELPTFDVVLIQRAQDVYYTRGGCSDRDQIYQSSGSERRSITNHMDLISAVDGECKKAGLTFSNLSLERTSVYYQYHIFSSAKVVIAQHGAALSNVFFMAGRKDQLPPDSDRSSEAESNVKCSTESKKVIEFSPPWSREFEHFKNLTTYCEIDHSSILQDEDHSDVDVSEVVKLLKAHLDKN